MHHEEDVTEQEDQRPSRSDQNQSLVDWFDLFLILSAVGGWCPVHPLQSALGSAQAADRHERRGEIAKRQKD